MDETEIWLVLFVRLGDPAVHDRALSQIDGRGFETGVSEAVAITRVSCCSEAETLGHYLPEESESLSFSFFFLGNFFSEKLSISDTMNKTKCSNQSI